MALSELNDSDIIEIGTILQQLLQVQKQQIHIKLMILPNSFNTNTSKSVNFGPGIEMLMNEKRKVVWKYNHPKSDVNID